MNHYDLHHKLQILMVFYDIDDTAGIQKAISNLSQLFVDRGYSVSLCLKRRPDHPPFPIPPDIKIYEHGMNEPESTFPFNIAKKIFIFIRLYIFLSSLLMHHSFDIVIDHGTSLGLLYPFRRLNGIPFILLRHFSTSGFLYGSFLYNIISLLGLKKIIVVLSEQSRHDMIKLGFSSVYYIPNYPAVNVSGKPSPPFAYEYIVAIGRPTPQKGFDILVYSFIKSNLYKESNLRLLIVGPKVPDLLPAQLTLSNSELLSKGIHLRDASRNISDIIKKSQFLVMPSRYEGMPMVAIESLAIGTPIIASDIDGLNSIISDDYNGLLFPPGNTQALSDSIRRLYLDRVLYENLKSNAIKSVKDFTPDKVFDDWASLFSYNISLPH